MKIAGMTSQNEAYIVTKDRPIRINEYLKICDPLQGDLLCETTETHAFNRFMPLDVQSDIVDKKVLESMKRLGYDIDDERIYIAKVRLLQEAPYPIETGSEVCSPSFEDIRPILVRCAPKEGLVLGAIQNTDALYPEADEALRGIFETFTRGASQEQRELPLVFPIAEMKDYPHIGVFGGSGSGKSYGIRVFIEEMMRLGIPSVVTDPHNEMTFESPDGRFDGAYRVFEVGISAGIPFERMTPPELIALLRSRTELSEAMESTVETVHRPGDTYAYFEGNLQRLLEMHEERDQEGGIARPAGEGGRMEGLFRVTNARSLKGLLWRLHALEKTGIFRAPEPDCDTLLGAGKTMVFRGDRRVLTVYCGFLLRKLYERRRAYLDGLDMDRYFPPFVSVIDEAHNFAPKGEPSPSKSTIREIAQEGRKYGVFLLLATQRPSILDDTTTAQLNSKFLFRTTRETDIRTIRDETDISSEEAKRLPYLESGNVFFSSAIMGRTVFLRMRKALSTQPKSANPFEEFFGLQRKKEEEMQSALLRFSPLGEMDYPRVLAALDGQGYPVTADGLTSILERLSTAGVFRREETIMGTRYVACVQPEIAPRDVKSVQHERDDIVFFDESEV